jgi:uncharacterized protein (TIGR03663 family)
VGTASTKRRRRQTRAARKQTQAAREAEAQQPEGVRVSERAWLVAGLVILCVAAVMRLYALELKPFHHDEGVNGFFLTNLIRDGIYKYDPTNYHGPTLYYFALPFAFLFGLTTFAVRLVPAVFGLATVGLALCLRRHLGAVAALAAAALIAVSPAAVFYSRYFIHEMMFAASALGAVVAAVYFYDTARPRYLLLAAASLAVHFATKETAFITVVVILLAASVAWGFAEVFPAGLRGVFEGGAPRARASVRTQLRDFVQRCGGAQGLGLLALAGVALFVAINVVFYSSFFTNWKGVADAFEALQVWTNTGKSEFHAKPPLTYVKWLLEEESPLLFLGALGSALALWTGRNRFAVFAGAWAFGTLAAYSLVPYKTPWLVLSFTVPLALAGGYAVQTLAEKAVRAGERERTPLAALLLVAFVALALGAWKVTANEGLGKQPGAVVALVAAAAVVGWCAWGVYRGGRGGPWRRSAPVYTLAALALVVMSYQTCVVTFERYDDDRYPYVYSHTRREFLTMVSEIKAAIARVEPGDSTRIAVTSAGPGADSYWPLPWYLNDYKPAWGASFGDALASPVVVGNATQDAQLRLTLGSTHRRLGVYPLRPGVDLVLYVRRDLAAR